MVELAEGSAERQTKVAACELLHSLVMVMLANSTAAPAAVAGGPGGKDSAPANVGLYQHVLPALFRLAVDVDLVTRQLFAPLTTQIIHLFTRNHKEENPYFVTTIETCLAGVTDVYEHCHPGAWDVLRWKHGERRMLT